MNETFSGYQKFVVVLIAFLQFTVILDFMILSPLGALLLEKLSVAPAQFGLVVSAYAFSAGISGLLAAGFADRFDRKKLLLFFYAGFVVGTFLCGIAPTYKTLLGARIVTGLFGGVIGSIGFAIIADIFPLSMRGRVMGVVQTAFAASQIIGIPLGLRLANLWGWHSPFLMIVGLCLVAGVFIVVGLKPVTAHLNAAAKTDPFEHLARTATNGRYVVGFAATVLLATGGYMLMPFGSTFLVQNLRISQSSLEGLYLVTGLSAIAAGPTMGFVSDKIGKYQTFVTGSVISSVVIFYYTGLSQASFWHVAAVNVALFFGISARMVSATALTSALPEMRDRGAYMSISSSMQQFSGGIAAWVAGHIVSQATPTSPLVGYNHLGWVVIGATALTVVMMFNVHRIVAAKVPAAPAAPAQRV